jgi:hypothetical protein
VTTRERPPSKQRMARPTRPPWSSTVAAMNVDLDGSNGSGSFFTVVHPADADEASITRAAPSTAVFNLSTFCRLSWRAVSSDGAPMRGVGAQANCLARWAGLTSGSAARVSTWVSTWV